MKEREEKTMENLEKNEIIDAEETFYTVKSASLDTCTKQIRNNLTGIVKNFVKIGYLLNVIRQNEFYKESYKDIYDYAKKELGMSKTNVKNFTNIVLRFGKRNADGQITNELQDQYCEYTSSQLVELLSLPEEKHKEVTPDMTVKQIREKKSENEPTDEDIRAVAERIGKRFGGLDIEPATLRSFYANSGYAGDGLNYTGTSRGMSINGKTEITWKQLSKRLRDIASLAETAGEPKSEPCEESDEKPLTKTAERTEKAILRERFDCARMDILDTINAILEAFNDDFENGKLPRGVYNTLSDMFGELGEQIKDLKL